MTHNFHNNEFLTKCLQRAGRKAQSGRLMCAQQKGFETSGTEQKQLYCLSLNQWHITILQYSCFHMAQLLCKSQKQLIGMGIWKNLPLSSLRACWSQLNPKVLNPQVWTSQRDWKMNNYLGVTLQLLLQLGLLQGLCHQWSFFQAFPKDMGGRQVACNFTMYFYFIKLAEDPSRADENCSTVWCISHSIFPTSWNYWVSATILCKITFIVQVHESRCTKRS